MSNAEFRTRSVVAANKRMTRELYLDDDEGREDQWQASDVDERLSPRSGRDESQQDGAISGQVIEIKALTGVNKYHGAETSRTG